MPRTLRDTHVRPAHVQRREQLVFLPLDEASMSGLSQCVEFSSPALASTVHFLLRLSTEIALPRLLLVDQPRLELATV